MSDEDIENVSMEYELGGEESENDSKVLSYRKS